jgi:glutamate--cysteine ligase catalytic subunit
MGWRVELRTMEVQLTDFENAAFTVSRGYLEVVLVMCSCRLSVVACFLVQLFTVLISRVILFFNLNLYIPISKVDANMAAARKRDAITSERFFFRSHVVPMPGPPLRCRLLPALQWFDGLLWGWTEKCSPAASIAGDPDSFELMTCEQILCGTGSHFPGLIPLIYTYLDIIRCDDDTRTAIQQYMHLIVRRVRGELPTCAKWMRSFIRNHPAYKHDSVVPSEIAYDLMQVCGADVWTMLSRLLLTWCICAQLCRSVSTGAACPELLGSASSVPVVRYVLERQLGCVSVFVACQCDFGLDDSQCE